MWGICFGVCQLLIWKMHGETLKFYNLYSLAHNMIFHTSDLGGNFAFKI